METGKSRTAPDNVRKPQTALQDLGGVRSYVELSREAPATQRVWRISLHITPSISGIRSKLGHRLHPAMLWSLGPAARQRILFRGRPLGGGTTGAASSPAARHPSDLSPPPGRGCSAAGHLRSLGKCCDHCPPADNQH